MSEKMRECFEDWAKSEQISIEVFAEDEERAGEYYFLEAHCAWLAWQASRAALVVELPRCWSDEARDYRDDLLDRLDEAGVAHK